MVVIEDRHTKVKLIYKKYFIELEPAINVFLESLEEYIDLLIEDIVVDKLDSYYLAIVTYSFTTRRIED